MSMRCQRQMTVFALLAGLFFCPIATFAESSSQASYKVLAKKTGGFNVSSVKDLLIKGDAEAARGNLEKARKHYEKAKKASRELLSFYQSLAGSFRGLDARIPREMDSKGREALVLLAKVNLNLAAVWRRKNQPEVAVPLLVEVVRLVTPAAREGQQAYQRLLELGFVDTPYAAARGSSLD